MYKISAGSKLSFGEMNGTSLPSTWTDLAGCTQIPEIGSAPDTVDSTTLDNLVFRSYVKGLQELSVLDFPFNLEVPSTASNINTIAGLNPNTLYGWRITYASGITVTITSKPSYSLNQVGVNEIESFTLHLVPEGEPVITVPSTSI